MPPTQVWGGAMQRAVTPFSAALCWVICSLLLLAGSLSIATLAFAQTSQAVTVERVVDGDTIHTSPAVGGPDGVRLIGVDTPEPVDPNEPIQPYGPEASAFTTAQLEGKTVKLTFDEDKTDQYGRALAYVQISGRSETLLRQGYGQLEIVSPNDRYEESFSEAQETARRAHRGIWGLSKDEQCELHNRGNGIGEGSPQCRGNRPQPNPPQPNPPRPNPPEPNPPHPNPPVDDKNCGNYPTQAAAQAELRRNPEDPYGLDGAKGRTPSGIPGVACEDNPPPEDFRPAPGYGGTPPSARSGDLLGNGQMLVMRTTEDPTNPLGELVSAKQTLRLDHFSLAVNPFGLYGVQPRT